MLPPKSRLPEAERKLLALFSRLPAQGREQLLAFAEFLVERSAATGTAATHAAEAAPTRPLDIPRPEAESVIAAIRRLSQTFPMLDREALLHDTSALMTAHVMQGRPSAEVIDELELVFRRHYRRLAGGEQVE
jgi:hypothetical protein